MMTANISEIIFLMIILFYHILYAYDMKMLRKLLRTNCVAQPIDKIFSQMYR
jgi:hypothetical protein